MQEDKDKQRLEAEAELERELRQARKFSPKEALARMAGPGAMKGASPISPLQQAETEIGTWLTRNVSDVPGAFQVVLQRHITGSVLLLDNLDQPLIALAGYCKEVLASDYRLKELVRQSDVEWGHRMDERPYFHREGIPEHPSDPYTEASVRETLALILRQLTDAPG